jgi:hypothetical protein
MPAPHDRPGARRAARPSPEPLEPRGLQAGLAPAFAALPADVPDVAGGAIPIRIAPQDFRLATGGRVLLGFELVAADGSPLDPAAVRVATLRPGGAIPIGGRDDLGTGTASLTLVAARPGALAITPLGEAGTTGAATLRVRLVGDANGDRRVDAYDLRLIREAIGRATRPDAFAPGADADGSGTVDAADLALARDNRGAATRVGPLALSAGIDPADDPDGDGRVDAGGVAIRGRTAPFATVRLDRDGDGTVERTARADARGRYRFRVALATGAHRFAVAASDRFGQQVSQSLIITRDSAPSVLQRFDFDQGALGWRSGAADLPPGNNPIYEIESGPRALPGEVGPGTGYLLQGHNRSDDLFLYLKRQLGPAEGVRAGGSYALRYTITLASNAPTGGVGIGGAPGESVYLKAGGSTVEPRAVPGSEGFLRLNVDKGNQSQGGPAATVAGDLANGQEPVPGGGDDQPYVTITRTVTHATPVRADAHGRLWLLVGTDSGFEGLTRVYVRRIDVELTPVGA